MPAQLIWPAHRLRRMGATIWSDDFLANLPNVAHVMETDMLHVVNAYRNEHEATDDGASHESLAAVSDDDSSEAVVEHDGYTQNQPDTFITEDDDSIQNHADTFTTEADSIQNHADTFTTGSDGYTQDDTDAFTTEADGYTQDHADMSTTEGDGYTKDHADTFTAEDDEDIQNNVDTFTTEGHADTLTIEHDGYTQAHPDTFTTEDDGYTKTQPDMTTENDGCTQTQPDTFNNNADHSDRTKPNPPEYVETPVKLPVIEVGDSPPEDISPPKGATVEPEIADDWKPTLPIRSPVRRRRHVGSNLPYLSDP